MKVILAFVLFIFWAVALLADTVELTWNQNPESNIAGYRVYWGTESGTYTESLEVVQVGAKVENLDFIKSGGYYFVVTAFNTEGLESLPSDELALVLPSKPSQPIKVNITIEGNITLNVQ